MRGRMVSVQLQVRVQHAEDSRCKMKLILRVGWESCPTALRRVCLCLLLFQRKYEQEGLPG
jgi:hypothetical protein